jgi:hypothetical protein
MLQVCAKRVLSSVFFARRKSVCGPSKVANLSYFCKIRFLLMVRQTGCVQTDGRDDVSVYAMVVAVFLSHWRSAVIVPDSISEVYYCYR